MIILKACGNNLFKAIETLVRDNETKQCTFLSPRVPNIQHLYPKVPSSRLPMFLPLPYNPTFTSPRIFPTSGLQFSALYPGHVNPNGTNPVELNSGVLESPYTISGNKNPWCLAFRNQPLNKRPLLSWNVFSPTGLSETGVTASCSVCLNVLNVGDRFCSQCGKRIVENC